MTMSKGAVGNLISRYRAVLKKCHLMNMFGSLAVAGMLVMSGAGVAEAWLVGDGSTGDPLYRIDGLDNAAVSLDKGTGVATVSGPVVITDASFSGIQARIDGKAEAYPQIDVTASVDVSAKGEAAVSSQDGIINIGSAENYVDSIKLHTKNTKLNATDPTDLFSTIYARNLFGEGQVNLYGKNVSITTEENALKEGSGKWGCAISGNGSGEINIHGKDVVVIRGAIESLNTKMQSDGTTGIKININQDAADTAKVDMEGIYINAADKSEVNIKGADGSSVTSKLIATASDKVSGGKINIALAGDSSSYTGVIDAKNRGEISVEAGTITAAGGAGQAVSVNGATVALEGKNIMLTSASSGGVSKTVEATNGATLSFNGAQTTIRNGSTTTGKNYGVYLDNAEAVFAADSTQIDVKGIGSSGNWGYGIDLWNGAKASFTGGAVSISDYQKDYTAQTVTVRKGSSLELKNSGDVMIKAESPYGATAVVVKEHDNASLSFDNTGNVTISAAIEDPAELAGTNVVGLMIEKGQTSFSDKVNQANFIISGQGCDFDGSSYSDGSVAVFVQDKNAKLTVDAKELNVNVAAAVDSQAVALEGKTYDDAYGLRTSAGSIVVGPNTKTTITVNESRGTAYGVVASGTDSKTKIAGDTSVTVAGNTAAYALFADDGGTIAVGSSGKAVSLTALGEKGVGIGMSDGASNAGTTVTLDGDTTISAANVFSGKGIIENSGNLTLHGSASQFTGQFAQTAGTTAMDTADFGGIVCINGGALNVAKTLDLSKESNFTVNNSGSLNVAAGGSTTFGQGFLTIEGGSVTADAGNFITDEFSAVSGAATSVVGTAGDLYLRFDGKTYTADQYKAAKSALFDQENEKALLTLLNGTLKVQEGETVVVSGTADPTTNKVTLSGVTPVVAKSGESANDSDVTIASVPDQLVRVVDSTDKDKELQTVGNLEIGKSVFNAKGLQVAPADAAAGVVLNLVDNSKITLIGGETEDSGVLVDGNNNAVKTHVVVGDGSALQLGMAGNAGKQMASFGTVEVQGKLDVAGNGLDTTRYGYEELKASHANAEVNLSNASILASTATLEKGAVNVLNATAHIGTLNPTGGTLFIDPAYVKIENLSGDTFGSSLLVGDGSVVEIGSIADLQAKAAEAGLNPAAFGNGFTVASGESMLALGKAVALGAGGKIVVDAGVDKSGAIGGVPVGDSAYFGNKSLLVVDSAIASGDGAIRANSAADTITVKKDAKLYLVDAKANGTYTVASGFGDASSTVEGWTGGDLMVNRLINAERIAGTDGRVTVKTTAKRASVLYPGISIPNTLDRMIGDKQNDVNSGNAGIKFLSRALEPQFLAEGDVIPTLDGAAQLAYAGGVQSSTITVAQAPVRAIQDHLSLAGKVAQKGTNLHENGFDLWANAIYGSNRTRDFSAGSLDAGYNSDFAGGVIGGDWTFDAGAGKGRVGLALNVGAGDTKSRGDFNSTKNDFDFWGMSLYGGWSMDNVNVVADLGYSASKNELKQDIPSSLGLCGRIKGDVDSSVITAGVKAEYMVKTDVLDVMPHVGVRYMAVKTDSFTTKLDMGGDLFHTDSDLQHVWQFPVGVNLSKTIETESGWKVKPQADLSVVPAAGDTKTKIDVRTPGVNASDSMKRRVMDTTSFDGVFGVEVQKDNVSFGLGYNIQASEHQTGQGVTASFMYKF